MKDSNKEKSDDDSNTEKKTIDSIIDEIGFGYFHILIVLANGLCVASDAMEMMLLSVVGPAVKCYWMLLDEEVALITMVVFLGMAFGALIFGWIADKYGRKKVIISCAGLVAVYGFWSAGSLSYEWMLITRFIVGTAVGGIAPAMCIFVMELTPTKGRNKICACIFSFWTAGVLLESGLAYFMITNVGWRWLLVVTSLPLFVSFFVCCFLPESPRFLLIEGQHDNALNVVNRVARVNKKPLFHGKLIMCKSNNERARFKDLFHPNYIRLSLLLFFIWFANSFSYYGNMLMSINIQQTEHRCLQNWRETSIAWNLSNTTDTSCCQDLTSEDYLSSFISSLGELVGLFTSFIFMEFFGRRFSLCFHLALAAPTFFMLNFCLPKGALNLLLLANRTLTSGSLITGFLYTSEAFPTTIRGLALGICSSLARIGSISSPLLSQYVLTKYSVFGALGVFTVVSGLGALAALFLPFDTKDRILKKTVYEPLDSSIHHVGDQLEINPDYQTFQKTD